MELQSERHAQSPQYPTLKAYYRTHRCALIKATVVAGSLAVLAAAGTAGYCLIQKLRKKPVFPPPMTRTAGVIMVMPKPPPPSQPAQPADGSPQE